MADSSRPGDVVVRLRQIISSSGKAINEYPEWFQEEIRADPKQDSWVRLLTEATDELENMQKLNGKLYKTLYG